MSIFLQKSEVTVADNSELTRDEEKNDTRTQKQICVRGRGSSCSWHTLRNRFSQINRIDILNNQRLQSRLRTGRRY